MRRVAATLALLAAILPASAADRLDRDQLKELTQIRRDLRDVEADAPALLARIAAMGPAAERALVDAYKRVLRQDERALKNVTRGAGDPEAIAAAEAEFDELRAEALENVSSLSKGEAVARAKEFHARLAEYSEQLGEVWQRRIAALRIAARRPAIVADYRELVGEEEASRRLDSEDEVELMAAVEALCGAPVEDALTAMEADDRPDDPALRRFHFHALAAAIRAWNETQFPLLDQGERENLVAVNDYRVSLGRVPLEIDHRLVQSARQHSKEMADLGYFSHSSPTEGRKSHTKRMKLAGYKGGHSENIANGAGSGEMAFWMWFSSPPHHKNMVKGGHSQFGVGRWGGLWTQNFGRGKTLMRLSQEEREEATTPACEILAPQDQQ